MLGTVLLDAIGGIINLGTGWVRHRQALAEKRQETELKVEEARAVAAGRLAEAAQAGEAAWDQLAIAQMEKSWKDEWLTLLFSIPLILCFIPGAVTYVEAGFAALERTPLWYQWAIGVILAAAFGYRRIADIITTMRK